MGSRPPTPIARPGIAEISKEQTPAYVSPLAQSSSMLDSPGRTSPQPPRYSCRPQSSPTSSPPVDVSEGRAAVTSTTSLAAATIDNRRRSYEYTSPPSQDRETDLRRERSTLPRIVSNGSTSSAGQKIDSLEAALGSHTLRTSSPRPLGNRPVSGDLSSTSLDNEQLRSLSLGRHPQVSQHQRSNSNESHSFKRWGPFAMNRMQTSYIPTNLKTNEDSNDASQPLLVRSGNNEARQQATLQLQNLRKDSRSTNGDVSLESIGSKRKHSEDTNEEQNNQSRGKASNGHVALPYSTHPSNQLYEAREAARDENDGPANGVDGNLEPTNSRRLSPDQAMQEQERDELVDSNGETDEEARNGPSRTVDGVLALPPQRKSCDRCFKMKTKCSRAAPGATGDEPCDGCIRRGFSNDCITSRPDFPYPRISLFKRARRESSLPALLNIGHNNSAVFVPPSMMQRGNDWRTKLIVNSLHKTGHNSHDRSQDNRSVDSQLYAESSNPHRLQSQHQSHQATANKHDYNSLPAASRTVSSANPAWASQSSITSKEAALQNNAGRANVSHLRSLATSELQDLSRSIAHEVTQRNKVAPLPPAVKTPVVPSVSHLGPLPHQPNQVSSRQIVQVAGGASLGQQAMQNTPMQHLPKAVGLPALDYFCQLVFPLFPLSALSPKVLSQRYENYIKPGRNNILELAVSIGLQLQGILLACPDKSQAHTAEGRIFKAFLQSSRQGQQQDSHMEEKSSQALQDNRMSIDSIKGWIEPTRHRSRAKDIVKHVMMRRCLKNGLDYDDVLENILLAYFYLLRGDSSAYHIFTGNAQRQLALLEVQRVTREDILWGASDVKAVQAKVISMERLHPIKYFTRLSSDFVTASTSSEANEDDETEDCVSLLKKLSDVAFFVQSSNSSANIEVEVDERLASFRQSLPRHLQDLVRSEWISNDGQAESGNSDWISDMIRGAPMTPCLRVNVCLNVCFIRLVARQSCLTQALCAPSEQDNDSRFHDNIRQVQHISSSILSSTLLACTVFPQLVSCSQTFATELSASAWNYLVSDLLLQQNDGQQSLVKMQDTLGQLIDILTSSQEKETWPVVSSLRMAKSITKDEATCNEWLTILMSFCKANPERFTRMLSGDAWAAEEFRKSRISQA